MSDLVRLRNRSPQALSVAFLRGRRVAPGGVVDVAGVLAADQPGDAWRIEHPGVPPAGPRVLLWPHATWELVPPAKQTAKPKGDKE